MPILVPIDPSVPSRAAVELAALLAQRLTGRGLFLLHVAPAGPATLDSLAALHALAAPAHDAGVEVHLRTVRGDPAPRIVEEARRRKVSWVFMGTRAEAFRGAARPSVALEVMRTAPGPVVAVRPGQAGPGPVGLIAQAIHGAAHTLARLLAEAQSRDLLPIVIGPEGTLSTPDGAPVEPATLVVACDPRCEHSRPCQQVLDVARCPVLLVRDADGGVAPALRESTQAVGEITR